jgi:hypothetical protein
VPSHEVVINMIEALGPGVESPLLQVDKLVAEPTPEAGLTVATNATGIELGFQDNGIRDFVTFLQMLLEGQSAVTHLGTGAAFNFLCVTAPSLDMEMPRVFMSFPIILAAESFVAS